jgi:putative addiction module component (TIGR02574 family)
MAVDIEALLALPNEERKEVAEKLWESLSPESVISEEDEMISALLDKRWEEIRLKKTKVYSSDELKKMISNIRIK